MITSAFITFHRNMNFLKVGNKDYTVTVMVVVGLFILVLLLIAGTVGRV